MVMRRKYDVEYCDEDIRKTLELIEERDVSDAELHDYLGKWFNKLDNGKYVYNDSLIEYMEQRISNLQPDGLIYEPDDE